MITPSIFIKPPDQDMRIRNDASSSAACGISPTITPDQSSLDEPRRHSKLFIKGPIPFSWLQQANSLGGSTGVVATALWFYVGIHKSRRFRIDRRLDQLCRLTRQTRNLVLERLQRHGLIVVHPKLGSYPTIEVRDL